MKSFRTTVLPLLAAAVVPAVWAQGGALSAADPLALQARIAQLEGANADLAKRLSDTEMAMSAVVSARDNAPKAEVTAANAAKADAEQKLALSLRAYSVIAEERDQLAAQLAALKNAQPAAGPVAAPAVPPSTASVTLSAPTRPEAAASASAEIAALRDRLAAAERRADAAESELTRLNRTPAATEPAVSSPSALSPSPSSPSLPVSASPASAAATLAPVATSAPAAASAIPAGEPGGTPLMRMHTLAAGDTLAKLSLQYYGTTARWREILEANRDILHDERSLIVGRVLRIP